MIDGQNKKTAEALARKGRAMLASDLSSPSNIDPSDKRSPGTAKHGYTVNNAPKNSQHSKQGGQV
jgi:hypothetical protein